jgi:outer membrane immunogenic protein
MKRFLLATVSMAALTNAARPADMPAATPGKERMYSSAPVATWGGTYFGVQGGVVRRDSSVGVDIATFGIVTFDGKNTGGTVGALIGHSWQQGSFVYGLEGDWSWDGANASHVTPDRNDALVRLSGSFDAKWLATLRGRAGLVLDATLLYVTGGAAFGNTKNTVIVSNAASVPFGTLTQDQTKAGWILGAGVEYMLSSHWTARAEFRYVDLGKTNVACKGITNSGNCVSQGYRGDFSNTLKLGLVGLNYKF